MTQMIFIALGGALGALMRYWFSTGAHLLLGKGFPYGTLLVNVTGSFLIGAIYVFMVERQELPPEWRSFLVVGLLGAFTTFSTFSFETIALFELGNANKAFMNIFISVFSCLAVCWLGMTLARQSTL